MKYILVLVLLFVFGCDNGERLKITCHNGEEIVRLEYVNSVHLTASNSDEIPVYTKCTVEDGDT